MRENMANIGLNIKRARLEKSLTVEELAKITNISIPSIYRYEGDYVGKISVENLNIIANALEIPVTHLLGLEDNNTVITGDSNILNGMSGSIGGNVTIGDSGQTKEQATETLSNQADDAQLQEKMLELLTDIAASVKGIEGKIGKDFLKSKM